MAAKTAVLEINGTRYDSHSVIWHEQKLSRQKSIDGMVASPSSQKVALAERARQPIHHIVSKPTMNDVVRSGANHLSKQLQPSQILMRKAVTRPDIALAKRLKATSKVKTVPVKKPAHTLQVKLSAKNVPSDRLNRASQASKSELVAKFSKTARSPSTHKLEAPITHAAASLAPVVNHKNKHHTGAKRTTTDIFEEALAHATSHQQKHHHKKKSLHKNTSVKVAAVAALFVVGGVFASQNIGNLQMYLAASKTGFTAALPDYRPSGYHLGKINSSAGVVAANYLSNTDDRSYTLTQKPSEWNSLALLENAVRPQGSDYYSVEKDGKTIFLYGKRHATWVSNGIWYDISANEALSDRQLLDIAASL